MSSRFISVQGDATTRGTGLGGRIEPSIKALLKHKQNLYHKSSGTNKPELEQQLNKAAATMKQHTPVCYAELVAISQAAEVPLNELLLLSCEYELWMQQTLVSDKCTGFVVSEKDNNSERLLLGQTNDESPEEWLNAALDLVVHHTDTDGLKTLIYTHPAIPAYMGMNSEGLVMLWQYIDNGERNLESGVPTTALIRETLTKKSLTEAVSFLKDTPRAVPNNYILAQRHNGAVNIECTPTRFIEKPVSNTTFCHANHIITDKDLKNQDIGVTRTSSTSRLRQKAIEQFIAPAGINLTVEQAKQAISTHPVYYDRTLAAMVFDVESMKMHIRFKDDPESFSVFDI